MKWNDSLTYLLMGAIFGILILIASLSADLLGIMIPVLLLVSCIGMLGVGIAVLFTPLTKHWRKAWWKDAVPQVSTPGQFSRLFTSLKILTLIGAVILGVLFVILSFTRDGWQRWFSIAPFIIVLFYAMFVVSCVLFSLWYLLSWGWKFLLARFSPLTAQRIKIAGSILYAAVGILIVLALKNLTLSLWPLFLCLIPLWIYILLGFLGAFDPNPKSSSPIPLLSSLTSHREGMFLSSRPKITILTADGQIQKVGKKKRRRMRREGKQITVLDHEADDQQNAT